MTDATTSGPLEPKLVICPSCDGSTWSRSASGPCMWCKGEGMVDPQAVPSTRSLHAFTAEQVRARKVECVSAERAMQAMPRRIACGVFCAQLAVGVAEKTSTNEREGYSYASAETILMLARAALLAEGIVFQVVDVQPEGERLAVTLQLEHIESGEVWQRTRRVAVVEDYKGRDKAESAAETLALSYFLRGVLAIPRIDVDVDARSDRRESRGEPNEGGARAAAGGAPKRSAAAAPATNPNAAVTVLLNGASNAKSVAELDSIGKSAKAARKAGDISERDFRTVLEHLAERRPDCEARDAHAASEGPQGAAA